MENILAAYRAPHGVSVVRILLPEQCPSRGDHDHPASNLYHGKGNPKERKHVGAYAERRHQQYEAVQRNATGKQSSCLPVIVEGEREKHWCTADGIDDRK